MALVSRDFLIIAFKQILLNISVKLVSDEYKT